MNITKVASKVASPDMETKSRLYMAEERLDEAEASFQNALSKYSEASSRPGEESANTILRTAWHRRADARSAVNKLENYISDME